MQGLSKSALHREARRLERYRKALQPLDLKRRQLIAERQRAQRAVAELDASIQSVRDRVRDELPMLADRRVGLSGLVEVRTVRVGERNVVGVSLPVLEDVAVATQDYGLLSRPHWVDGVAARLCELLERQVERRVLERQHARLVEASAKATQRVNLFEKVLIPRAERRIRKLRIHLGELERAGLVRAKMVKRKIRAGPA